MTTERDARKTTAGGDPGVNEMLSGVPVAKVVDDLRSGNNAAQGIVFEVFYPQLRKAAQLQLQSMPRNTGDAEVAASSTLRSFFRNVQKNELTFHDRTSIHFFLLHTLAEKVLEQRRRASAGKRSECAVQAGDTLDSECGERPRHIEDVAANISSPELTTITKNFFEVLYGRLNEREKEVLARLIDGDTQLQIAGHIQRSLRTVEATIAKIRTKARQI